MIAPTIAAIGRSVPEALAQHVEVDVEHHHDEQEQHHHRADVDQHQRDREELGLQQHPDRGCVEEREHQEQRGDTGLRAVITFSADTASSSAKM